MSFSIVEIDGAEFVASLLIHILISTCRVCFIINLSWLRQFETPSMFPPGKRKAAVGFIPTCSNSASSVHGIFQISLPTIAYLMPA